MMKRSLSGSVASVEEIEKLETLLVFPKDSGEYRSAFSYFLQLTKIENSAKAHLSMLLNDKRLSLPLTEDKLQKLPHLLNKETDISVIDLLSNLAKEKKLNPLILAYFLGMLEKRHEYSNSFILNIIFILLQNYYGSLASRDKESMNDAIKLFLSNREIASVGITGNLLLPLSILREYLYSSQDLRLEARDIITALNISLDLSSMLSLSIEGIKYSSEQVEDVVLVIGPTKSGKSTLINYVAGVEYKQGCDQTTGTYYLQHIPGQKPPLVREKHDSRSGTLYPFVVVQKAAKSKPINVTKANEMEFKTEVKSEEQQVTETFAFVDTPGFDNNPLDDVEQKMCAAVGIPLAIHHAKKIRALVVVIPWYMLIDHDVSTEKFILLSCQTLENILKNLLITQDKSSAALIFAISKPPRPERDEFFDADNLRIRFREHISQKIKSSGSDLDPKIVRLFDVMQNSGNIFIIRGYQGIEGDTNDHRVEFLSYLKWLREKDIHIPKEHFEFDATNTEFVKIKNLVMADCQTNTKANIMLINELSLAFPDKSVMRDSAMQRSEHSENGEEKEIQFQLTTTSLLKNLNNLSPTPKSKTNVDLNLPTPQLLQPRPLVSVAQVECSLDSVSNNTETDAVAPRMAPT
jgi:energy-coupling factor transporter ATP-binding protein EcfA2